MFIIITSYYILMQVICACWFCIWHLCWSFFFFLGKFCIMLRVKEKHNIKKSQTNHAGKLITVDLTALRLAGNEHLGFPGHHSPYMVFYSGWYFLYKSNLSPLECWAPFRRTPENSIAAFGYRFQMVLSLQLWQ